MRRILVGAVLCIAFMPVVVFAQVPTCEQRLAVMGQIVEDMSSARAVVTTAEVEAASLKVQVKTLQEQVKTLGTEVETLKTPKKDAETK